jgi:hypothetical protein
MFGFCSDELLETGLLQQAVPLVRKPVEFNELTDAVRDARAVLPESSR